MTYFEYVCLLHSGVYIAFVCSKQAKFIVNSREKHTTVMIDDAQYSVAIVDL